MGCRNLQGQVRKKSLLGLLFFCQYALLNVSPQYTAVNELRSLKLDYQTKDLFSYTKTPTQGIFDKPIFLLKIVILKLFHTDWILPAAGKNGCLYINVCKYKAEFDWKSSGKE